MVFPQKASFWEHLRSPFRPCVPSVAQKASMKTISCCPPRVCLLLWVKLHKVPNRGIQTPSGEEEKHTQPPSCPLMSLCSCRREQQRSQCVEPLKAQPSSSPAPRCQHTGELSIKPFSPSGNFLQPALLLQGFDLSHCFSSKEHWSIPAAGWERWKHCGAEFITGTSSWGENNRQTES